MERIILTEKRKCCDNDCKTPEEMIAHHMIPIEIIGCQDTDIQLAHMKYLTELRKKYKVD